MLMRPLAIILQVLCTGFYFYGAESMGPIEYGFNMSRVVAGDVVVAASSFPSLYIYIIHGGERGTPLAFLHSTLSQRLSILITAPCPGFLRI